MKPKWRIRRAICSRRWHVYPPFQGGSPYVFPTWREAIDFVTTGIRR